MNELNIFYKVNNNRYTILSLIKQNPNCTKTFIHHLKEEISFSSIDRIMDLFYYAGLVKYKIQKQKQYCLTTKGMVILDKLEKYLNTDTGGKQ